MAYCNKLKVPSSMLTSSTLYPEFLKEGLGLIAPIVDFQEDDHSTQTLFHSCNFDAHHDETIFKHPSVTSSREDSANGLYPEQKVLEGRKMKALKSRRKRKSRRKMSVPLFKSIFGPRRQVSRSRHLRTLSRRRSVKKMIRKMIITKIVRSEVSMEDLLEPISWTMETPKEKGSSWEIQDSTMLTDKQFIKNNDYEMIETFRSCGL